ncbi:undecaprenyl-phosphate glucose phosphotransferase [Agaribacter marinus]|uniref:Undecaprenyl-phosphate glucose phosphotransferase n=1 Tax=Agaribacter marinus TaxID=1431249 RepID=A0AA37SZT6_9ALTE|nr:undecaprenyl-phosphate glucose phosphotransferase [Agaribacter marinus]GLR72868.1 undecaprenyl-phosphate glucose phosphotransferase [Agaribacter marinus]
MKSKIRNNRGGIIQSNKSSFATLYRLTDLVSITLIYYFLLFNNGFPIKPDTSIMLLVGIIIFNIFAEALDLYRSWRTQSTTTLLKMTAITWAITFLALVIFSFFFPNLVNLPQNLLMTWLGLCFPALTAWRLIFREVLFSVRKKGRNTRAAAIIGATPSGFNLMNQLVENEQLGIQLFGIFDDRDDKRLPHEFQNQVAGTIADVVKAAKEGKIDYIYVAMPMSAESRIMQILNQCSDTTCNVYIIPNFFIYNLLNARWQTVGAVQTLSVFDTPFQGANNVLKRIEDIVFSVLILAMISIPMLAIAIGVKVTSKGPVLFKQFRYGLDGKKIKVYKFRSMTVQDNGDVVKQATKNDVRITPFGGFLRRTSLDELPQFINVIQGRMSIVGPRPHAVAHNEEYRKLIEGYMLRHKVKPGITGWAQVNGFRGETETVNKMVKRVEYDLDYIHRWSVWLDVKIIFATVFKGFINKNAY